ncbi:sugar translocase [Kibdelosporangium phytohabitans]|uniref:Sugar translocase n=1 Tax=Kibdelosporangium phytohabitans TaxID=860235 RepID=A0A0N9IK71_9PSEU|nr:sugar translocase [Kibdelosporangium phytohabitans]
MRPIDSTGVRFGLVGAANTLLDACVFLAIAALGVPLVVANLISTSAGMLLSFALNRTYTFRTAGTDVRRQAVLFFAVTLTGLWVVQAGVIALLASAPLVVAKGTGIAAGMVWNYVLYRRLVFRQRPEAGCGQ